MPHLLIVDDNATTREALTGVAGAAGFSASATASLREARLHAARQRPDLVLADAALPDGNGLDLLDLRVPLVLMTGLPSVDGAVDALRRGAVDYLARPLDAARVRAALAGVTRAPPLAGNAIAVPLGTSLDDADRALILATLEYCGGVRKRAADLLGISLKTLYNRLVAYRAQGAPGNGGARGPHPIRPEERHAPRHS